MNARRSFASLAWGAGALVLLLGGSCQEPGSATPDAGQDQPSADLAVSMLPPEDAVVVQEPPLDLTGASPLDDLAQTTPRGMTHPPSPDMTHPPLPPDLAVPPRDVTFYVVADTHNDPAPEPQAFDERASVHVINGVSQNGLWPTSIGGTTTGFVGGKIAPPVGVVFVGDLTGWGTAPTEIPEFRHYYEKGNSAESINFPAYLGLGNHDIDTADRSDLVANTYRAL